MGRGNRMWIGVLACWLGAGCAPANQASDSSSGLGATSQPEAPTGLPRMPNGAIDTSGGPIRVIEVPSLSGKASIVSTPTGYFALSSRTFNSGKVILGYRSALYRSDDGVHWRRVPLAGEEGLGLTDLAYGNGNWVMVGRRKVTGHVYHHSRDGVSWTEHPQELDSSLSYRRVVFAGGRFFGLGSRRLGVSEDGERWTHAPITLVQPMAIAHGNGRYVLMGSGPVEVSTDGLAWSAHELPCDLPGACISDPDGGVHQGHQSHLWFVEGRFFADQLSSEDGLTWEPLPGRYPVAYADGFFFEPNDLGSASNLDLQTWTTGGAQQRLMARRTSAASVTLAGRERVGLLDTMAPLPDNVDASFPDGLTCKDTPCVIVAGRMYALPPAGTPALPDLRPRVAGDSLLLTDMCPVSRQVFCDDYAARAGCECSAHAPKEPSGCARVEQFTCEGHFTPRDDEWHVAEVAEGGCSCSGVDDSGPKTFGLSCSPERGGVCAAPLTCLEVDSPAVGVPTPQRFMCTAACRSDADCPSWEATGFCGGPVQLRCSNGSCQPRTCP